MDLILVGAVVVLGPAVGAYYLGVPGIILACIAGSICWRLFAPKDLRD